MSSYAIRQAGWLIAALCLVSGAFAQDKLSLDDALAMAKDRNGSVRSAYLDYQASKAAVVRAQSAFYPTLTPQASREWGQSETFTGLGHGAFDTSGTSFFVDANWQLWDNGTRKLAVSQAKFSAEGSSYSAYQTLRNTLFDVQSKYYDALRSQKLLEVQDRSVERAKESLDETEARTKPPIEDLPRKDVYQARADYANALVSRLAAKNQVTTSAANLKAVLGFTEAKLPTLEQPDGAATFPEDLTLEDAIAEGMKNRPDLLALRMRESGQEASLSSTKLDAGINYSLDATYRRTFAEDPAQRTALVLSASIPLYDGERSKENIRIQRLNLESIQASLSQSELNAKAEIESAYLELSQNLERLDAAKTALEAAKVNYDLTQEAFTKYRAATLVERLTAQVTLTTAESNLVQATYDTLISEVRLQLATGRPLAGE